MNWEQAFNKLEKEFRESRATVRQLSLDLGAGSYWRDRGVDVCKSFNEETDKIILECKNVR
jgi:hypothetical protein